ncbi:MAG: hypothetical protein F4Z95_01400 [Gammaproteobacteria bacterium]|nr:hypothetical protein [Gammaproteobacteria bacterium]
MSGRVSSTLAVVAALAFLRIASAADSVQTVPFFPSASEAWDRQGVAQIINRSGEAGKVTIEAIDDEGATYEPLSLSINPGETVHFNSFDLEVGNPGKGLSGSTGPGRGDWRLRLASELDIKVVSFIRTSDGVLAPMQDTAPWRDGGYRLAFFNPGSDRNHESLLRLVNPGKTNATVEISGVDDAGASSPGRVTTQIPAGAARMFSAAELESGRATGLDGSLGDGAGKWRLSVRSDQPVTVMGLLSSPTGRLTNLLALPDSPADGIHRVPLFPPVSDPLGRQGLVRIINHSDSDGEVSIRPYDDTGRQYEGLTLSLGANEAKHFNSYDLEIGNARKGLTGSTGAGAGDWRLELASGLAISVLSYISSPDGVVAPVQGTVQANEVTRTFDFSEGEQGFVGDFADYPPDNEDIYELTSEYRPLPSPLDSGSALYLSGVNRSDDLVMFYKGQVGGLVPGAIYNVAVSAEIATDTPAGCVGVGGAPGESVWIKAGASDVEPLPVLRDNYLRMNIDIGNQSNGGENAVVLGNMANSRDCEQPRQWERKSFEARSIPQSVSASETGQVWLFFGTDSGFEARTEVYFTQVTVTFTPLGPDTPGHLSDPIPLHWLPPRKDRPDVL